MLDNAMGAFFSDHASIDLAMAWKIVMDETWWPLGIIIIIILYIAAAAAIINKIWDGD